MRTLLLAVAGLGALAPRATSTAAALHAPVSVVVTEGTSMSVVPSPDGRTLAIDLQGSIWTLPASGGEARRVTDEYNDARQPTWSPDGKTIAFQGYRDGGYDIWAIDADGANLRKLTSGPFDDREPAWSRDGRHVAFSSDRARSGETAVEGHYNIWHVDIATGALTQVTDLRGDEYMPSWSASGDEIAFVGTRDGGTRLFAARMTDRSVRELPAAGGRLDAPSFGIGGELVYHLTAGGRSQLMRGTQALTGDENAFAFRAGWLGPREIVYVSDGKIRRRSLDGSDARTVEFCATLVVNRPAYTRRVRDLDSRTPRRARGIVAPAISPDGKQVAFAALGDLYVMAIGGTPLNLTRDTALDTEPAWSPNGRFLAWSTDRAGGVLDLWIRDMTTGTDRRLTQLPHSAMGASWSPDGTRIAFLEVDGVWRRANVSVVDVASGKVTQIYPSSFGPGTPTWSPDGQRVAIAALAPYSARFREGTNQIVSIPVDGSAPRWQVPVPHLSIDSRVGAGPVWSPDGSKMAVIYEGALAIVPVSPAGEALGPPRRITQEMAHAPTWTADSRTILYQSMDRLRTVDVESGESRDVPVSLTYRPAVPTARLVVHAGRLVDGRSPSARAHMDIEIVGNRIRRVSPHRAHPAGVQVVDASEQTVMPGLIEYHTHLQKDLGAAANRAYLAFGITTVRSPGGTPYEAVEDREAVDVGVRPGPRMFTTGYLLEWNRVYYKMAVAVSSNAHLALELERARALQHDMIKSYVRMPDIQQRRIIEFAHRYGLPTASHEVYPSALSGIDGTEHTTGTSRRGYSPKAATLNRSYADVAKLFAASGMPITPTLALGGGGMRRLFERDATLRNDARFGLYPPWLRASLPGAAAVAAGGGGSGPPPNFGDPNAAAQMVMGLMRAGTKVVAGTDTPNAATLHGELFTYVEAGMTPYEALRTATVNAAEQLGIPAGTVEVGKLADLVIVDGNPLEDITAALRVQRVVANGRVFAKGELLGR